MDFEEMIETFSDNHPFWAWILARLIICVCCGIVATFGFFALIAAISPLILFSEPGAGWGAFAGWFLIPLFATVIWLMCSIIAYVWQEFIE